MSNKIKIIVLILCLVVTSCGTPIQKVKTSSKDESSNSSVYKDSKIYNEIRKSYKLDSLNKANISSASLNALLPGLNMLNDTGILKIESEKSVTLLKNYYQETSGFYKRYPADELEDTDDYVAYAEKYASGDKRIIYEVDSIINSGNKDAIKKLLLRLNRFISPYNDYPISDSSLIDFILKTLEDPFYEEASIALIASLDDPDAVVALEKHLAKVKPENELKLLYHLVQNNSKVGIETFKKIIIQEKDSILYKSDLARILVLIESKTYGKKIDKKSKTEISSLAINNIFFPIVSKIIKPFDDYSNRINIYDINRTGRLNGANTLTRLIEQSDESIIPFLNALIAKKNNISDLNTNFINFQLLRLGHTLDDEALKDLRNDNHIARYMCRNGITIESIENSERFYEMIFKDYISSIDINDTRFGGAIIYNVLPYFKSVEHSFFKNQILSLMEEKEGLRPIESQKKKANRLINLHNSMNESEQDVLNYLDSIGFLSKNQSNLKQNETETKVEDSKGISPNLFRVIRKQNKTIRFSADYKAVFTALETSENEYLKDFETITWLNSKNEVEKVCIIYDDKAYAVNLSKFYPYDCKFDKVIEFINYILKDNEIEDRVIAHNKISCDIYFCLIGNENAIDAIEQKYLEY